MHTTAWRGRRPCIDVPQWVVAHAVMVTQQFHGVQWLRALADNVLAGRENICHGDAKHLDGGHASNAWYLCMQTSSLRALALCEYHFSRLGPVKSQIVVLRPPVYMIQFCRPGVNINSWDYHGLRGSANPMLTATGLVNGRWQFSTLQNRHPLTDRQKLSQVITSATPTAVPNLGVSGRMVKYKGVVPCWNKIILKNFRPEPPPSIDRPKIILFQHGTTSEIK